MEEMELREGRVSEARGAGGRVGRMVNNQLRIEAERALAALRLEVPASIADDVASKCRAVFDAGGCDDHNHDDGPIVEVPVDDPGERTFTSVVEVPIFSARARATISEQFYSAYQRAMTQASDQISAAGGLERTQARVEVRVELTAVPRGSRDA